MRAADFLQGRAQRVAERLQADGHGGWLAGSPADIYWVTGKWDDRPVVVSAAGEVVPATGADADDVRSRVRGSLLADPAGLGEPAGRFVAETSLPIAWRPDLGRAIRRAKDRLEIAALSKAAEFGRELLAVAEKVVGRGCSREADVAVSLERALLGTDAVRWAFEPSVGTGDRSSLVWARPSDRQIGEAAPTVVDVGVIKHGYASDQARTYLGSAAPDSAHEARRGVEEALEAMVSALGPRVAARDIDRVGRERIAAIPGAAPAAHAFGHGVGLDVHEWPFVSKSSEHVLAVGDVVALEPGAILGGGQGVRVESMFVVVEEGGRPL